MGTWVQFMNQAGKYTPVITNIPHCTKSVKSLKDNTTKHFNIYFLKGVCVLVCF